MKKLVQMLMVVCMVVLSTQVAFANVDKVTTYDGADLTTIQRLAVGQPLYIQREEKAPKKEDLLRIIFETSRSADCYVMSYDEVAAKIQQDAKLDITVLETRKAAKAFKEHVGKYADAYVIATVSNSILLGTTFFFDVYKAGSNDLLYTYEIHANKGEADSEAVFRNLSSQFYKHFSRSVESQQKKAAKDAAKAAMATK